MLGGSTFCLIISVNSLETKEKKSTQGNFPGLVIPPSGHCAPLDIRVRALDAAPPVHLLLIGTTKL